MIELISFLYSCFNAYRITKKGVVYFAILNHGIPETTVLIGRGRDAWVVTHLALEHQLTHCGMENVKQY